MSFSKPFAAYEHETQDQPVGKKLRFHLDQKIKRADTFETHPLKKGVPKYSEPQLYPYFIDG